MMTGYFILKTGHMVEPKKPGREYFNLGKIEICAFMTCGVRSVLGKPLQFKSVSYRQDVESQERQHYRNLCKTEYRPCSGIHDHRNGSDAESRAEVVTKAKTVSIKPQWFEPKKYQGKTKLTPLHWYWELMIRKSYLDELKLGNPIPSLLAKLRKKALATVGDKPIIPDSQLGAVLKKILGVNKDTNPIQSGL